VAVLAGGASQRMGQNKALLPLGGQPMIARVIQRVRPLADETIVIANSLDDYGFLGVRVESDRYPGVGPLAGLHAALEAARADLVVLLACDMPFINVALLRYLLSYVVDADAVVPRVAGREEPLHAVYRRAACLPPVERALRDQKRRLIAFLPEVRTCFVEEGHMRQIDPRLLSFRNVNTPDEWAEVVAMVEKEAS